MKGLQSKIAWAGELELLEARWTDKDGHTVKFRLVSPNEDRPNPFKPFLKRRKGRAGTRFVASCAHLQGAQTDVTTYDGELMLAGWADSSTQGYTVTFWCEPPESGMHAFESYTRTIDSFMCVLVELDDNDSPVDQNRRDRVERATQPAAPQQAEGGESGKLAAPVMSNPACVHCGFEQLDVADPQCHNCQKPFAGPDKKKPRQLSQYAAMLCSNPDFHLWIAQSGWVKMKIAEDHTLHGNPELAAEWMRRALSIDSRREIDQDPVVAERYHEGIRKPFVAWQERRDEQREKDQTARAGGARRQDQEADGQQGETDVGPEAPYPGSQPGEPADPYGGAGQIEGPSRGDYQGSF